MTDKEKLGLIKILSTSFYDFIYGEDEVQRELGAMDMLINCVQVIIGFEDFYDPDDEDECKKT